MYSVKKSDAKVLDLPARVVNILVGSDKLSSDHMTVGLTEVHPHAAMVPHSHDDMEEIIYVIEGQGEANVGGSIEKLEPNTAVIFPTGVPHAVTNIGPDVLRFVFMFNPPNDFKSVT